MAFLLHSSGALVRLVKLLCLLQQVQLMLHVQLLLLLLLQTSPAVVTAVNFAAVEAVTAVAVGGSSGVSGALVHW